MNHMVDVATGAQSHWAPPGHVLPGQLVGGQSRGPLAAADDRVRLGPFYGEKPCLFSACHCALHTRVKTLGMQS